MGYYNMNEEEKQKKQTDEIGGELESESEVNAAIDQQGADAAAGIPRGEDAARHEKERNKENGEIQGTS